MDDPADSHLGDPLPDLDPAQGPFHDPRLGALVAWLVSGSADEALDHVVPELAQRLHDLAIPVSRIFVTATNKHPEVFARGVIWQQGRPLIVREVSHDYIAKTLHPMDQGKPTNPIAHVTLTQKPFRRRLTGPANELEWDALREVKEQGQTDYLALPLSPTNHVGAIIYCTAADQGFTDAQLNTLRQISPFLRARMLLEAERYSMRSLLTVYLGRNAATRVEQGAFRRGTGERIRAAIWFCDLRNFTAMSDGANPEEVVRTLDQYFERVGDAVMKRGGEILKFIGDAILAIFPTDKVGVSHACTEALAAARDALTALAALNAARARNPPLEIGVALHVGEVMYGNIGARERLDFTVIGASVNEVCRLESLCKPLRSRIIVSEAVARELAPTAEGLKDLGEHSLKGVTTPRRVFGADAT